MNNPLDFFEGIYCITLSEKGKKNAEIESKKLGISSRVEFFSPPSFSSFNLDEISTLEAKIFYSYRHLLEKAYRDAKSNALVFLDSTKFINLSSIAGGLNDLSENFRLSRGSHWELILLGTYPKDNLVNITSNLVHVIRGCSVYCAGFNHTFMYPFIENIGSTEGDIIKTMTQTGVRLNAFEDWIQRYKFAFNLLCISPLGACVNSNIHYKQYPSIQEQKENFNFFCGRSILESI